MRKHKIFYLSWIAPVEGSGATLAMRRHFVEHRDFEVFVATSTDFSEPGIASYKVGRSPLLQRLSNTRFVRAVRNFEILLHSTSLRQDVLEQAERFRPDAVFTVADLTLSEQARKLAQKLGVPLVVNFQDWWPRGQFYYDFERPYIWVRPILEHRFRRLHREADLAFCTSEGMREFLGPHPNAHVLYPIGASDAEASRSLKIEDGRTGGGGKAVEAVLRYSGASVNRMPEIRGQMPDVKCQGSDNENETRRKKKRLIYTGTAFGGYGRMLRELARELEKQDEWELVIFGNTPDWPKEELEEAKRSGLYRGLLKFDELQRELEAADACLAVMSFEPDLEVMMRTSFTTKLLDYCRIGKPVILWGPEYCSPVRLARRRGLLTVETSDAKDVLDVLNKEHEHPGQVANKAWDLGRHEFAHEHIHGILLEQLVKVADRESHRRQPSAKHSAV